MRTISNGRIGIGLFKKLTPYIIIWLAGFGLQTPFKIKNQTKRELCWVSVHDRHYMWPIETGDKRKNAWERQTEQ